LEDRAIQLLHDQSAGTAISWVHRLALQNVTIVQRTAGPSRGFDLATFLPTVSGLGSIADHSLSKISYEPNLRFRSRRHRRPVAPLHWSDARRRRADSGSHHIHHRRRCPLGDCSPHQPGRHKACLEAGNPTARRPLQPHRSPQQHVRGLSCAIHRNLSCDKIFFRRGSIWRCICARASHARAPEKLWLSRS
jgi:hypothetical protein